MKYASIGSVSHGTLLTQDLLDTFARELQYHVQRNADEWCSEEGRANRDYYLRLAGEALEVDPDFQAEAASTLVNVDLIDALTEFAPPYCYFGTREGDGADFGFWPAMDEINELPCYESVDAAIEAGEKNDFRTLTDHGNVTVWGIGGTEVLSLV